MKKKLLTLALVFAGVSLNAQTYFEEDFDGASLTANNSWSVYNVISNSFNHEWYQDVFSGNGRARVSNFDNGSNTNEELESWLISPAIDLTGSNSPVLAFDNTKRFAGDDIELLISTDYDGSSDPSSGFTWADFTAAANFNSTTGNWDMTPSDEVDLSTYNGQTIYIAYKYYGSNSDGSTYQIDNIILEEVGTSGACSTAIFCDDFEGGSITGNNPWVVYDVISSTSGLTWGINTFNNESRAQITNFTGGAGGVNEELESWLITPAIDLSSYSDIILSFDNTKRFEGDDMELMVSTDYDGVSDPSSGFNWDDLTSVANFNSDETSWNMTNSGAISLNTYAGDATVYIAFKYYGGTSDGSTYRIDNVIVDEFTTPGLETIYDIQFTTDASGDSPLEGQSVTTTGIVTAVGDGFYFIQDGVGAWNGVEVFDNNNEPTIGDSIVISGTVEEFFGMTQIASITSFTVISSGNDLPAETIIDCADVGESYEGVLIRVEEVICTNEDAGFNMWEVNDGTAAVRVDDKFFVYNANQGNTYNVTGVINYAFSNFRISPRTTADIDDFANTDAISNHNSIALYPNPANDYIIIDGIEKANTRITVYDLLGNQVLETLSSEGTTKIETNNLNQGVYILSFGAQRIRFVKK
jgi:hypothetical protein